LLDRVNGVLVYSLRSPVLSPAAAAADDDDDDDDDATLTLRAK